jgi:phosphoglycolate phosphatase
MLQPQALLFDLDGVLVDSFESWLSALNHAFQSFDIPKISREEFTKTYWGHDLYDNLERAGLTMDIGPFCNAIYEHHIDKVRIYPHTIETLKQLDSYKKAVITNTPESCALQILEQFDITKFFEVVATTDQVDRGKPDPAIVYKSCSELRVDPKQCVIIGDTTSDIKAGKAAGCTVIGVRIQADYHIESLDELLSIIQVNNV